MRITQSMISKNLIEGLKNNREQLNESQRRISTGKKHAKISDDPESFSKAKRLLKWKPIYNTDDLIEDMISSELDNN